MIDWNFLHKLEKEAALDNVRTNTVGPYTLFKYSQGCHINGNWNEYNVEARGIIFNTLTGEIICRPMAKFFNLGERPESSLENMPDTQYVVQEKLDGSNGNAYMMWGHITVATPGSMESDQAAYATTWLRKHLKDNAKTSQFVEVLQTLTPIFEIIWPDNPGNNVLSYGDREELVLLTIRNHNGTEITPHMVDEFAEHYGFSRPRIYEHTLTSDIDKHIKDNEEGYVIYYPQSAFRIKIKSSLFKMLHKMIDKLSPKGILELIQGREYRYLQETLAEHSPEIAKQADDIAAGLRRRFFELKYLADDVYAEAKVLSTRKEQATYIKTKEQAVWGLVFSMLDDKYHDEQTWNMVKRGLKE